MNKESVDKWVNEGPNPDLLRMTEQLGMNLVPAGKKDKEKLSTSQIRQVFSKLKAIEAKGFSLQSQRLEFMMLKPFLAYAQGRDRDNPALNLFKETMTWGIDAVLEGKEDSQEQRFNHFCKLFEAVLAYHKAFGGK